MKMRLTPFFLLVAVAAILSAPHLLAQAAAATEEVVVLLDDEANAPAEEPAAAEAPAEVAPAAEIAPAAEAPAEVAPAADEGVLETKTGVVLADEPETLPTNVTNDKEISLSFDDVTIADVIKAFRDVSEANIIAGNHPNLAQHVSVKLEKVSWRQGLASILDTADLSLKETPPGSNIYTVVAKNTVVPTITKTLQLKHASSTEIADVFNRAYGNKDSKIANAFPAANVVVVKASEEVVAECEKIIAQIDKPVPQIYIEARFARLSAGASKKLGMKWDSLANGWTTSVGPISGGLSRTNGKWPGAATTVDGEKVPFVTQNADPYGVYDSAHFRGLTGSMTVGQMAVTLQAIEEMDGASIFSNPKIIVANERPAIVDMTDKEPCIEVTTSRTGDNNNQLDVSTKLATIPGKQDEHSEPWVGQAYFSYGITLNVLPRVSPDGLITVDIVPTVSEKTGESTLKGSGTKDSVYATYPIIKTQRLTTRFTMQDGTTAVIGGLSESREANVDSGIPLLRDIPWIGPRLFGWKSREKTQDEIVIFVTVGVANPKELPSDIGMPKNAVLSKKIQSGELKEPGDAGFETTIDSLKE